jgi:hypothetical protein
MDYIPRLDELLVAPPFLLGTDLLGYKFETHAFLLQVDHAKLQEVVDQQLNAAFPSGPIHYRVPTYVQRAWLAFVRYERAESQSQPGQGWLAYTEAMIGFLVLREPHPQCPGSCETELLTYLGVVYIDDSEQTGQIQDPHTLPIVLGREAYGLPKNPGQILYKPIATDPGGAELEVWDRSSSSRLSLSYAIRVRFVPYGALRPLTPQPPVPPFSASRWFAIEKQFGVEAGTLALERHPEREHGWRLAVPGETNVQAVVWEHLLWRTKLVGLKQFPDPTVKWTGVPKACYRAAVETPLVEVEMAGNPGSIMLEQDVEFPLLNRIDLMTIFGIHPTSLADPRKVRVKKDSMWYQAGTLVFANPDEVTVWDAP